MSSPRLRRLMLDNEKLRDRFSGWPAVQITEATGMPPERYQFRYNLKGLYVATDGQILDRKEHLLEVNLSLGYPRRAPHCKMLTPVFHPNFDDASVCIGDFWAASEGLDDLIVRIGRMISYQEYNTKSPLNGLAAKWTDEHLHMLPIDTTEVSPPGDEESTSTQTIANIDKNGEGSSESKIAVQNNTADKTTSDGKLTQNTNGIRLHFSSNLKLQNLVVNCSDCSQPMELKSQHFGRRFTCPNCGEAHEVQLFE